MISRNNHHFPRAKIAKHCKKLQNIIIFTNSVLTDMDLSISECRFVHQENKTKDCQQKSVRVKNFKRGGHSLMKGVGGWIIF